MNTILQHPKTSILGLALAILSYIAGHPDAFPPSWVSTLHTVNPLLVGLLGLAAADGSKK